MFSRHIQTMRRTFGKLAVVVVACASLASASATLFLEEPYGKLGFFTATGHAAVYLSGVCAETPVKLRPCLPGETGIVISRYDGVGDYDWVAIPLIPYLYAVERPEDVPLLADAKMVFFLRDHYRRKYLEGIAPDRENGEAPGGNWYELVGSSYDRMIYGFDIETTPEQDAALISKLNTSPNVSHFHLVSRNCADFAKDIINFYYPKTLHRSVVADAGMTTPKQMAKLLTRFSKRHPELQFSRMVIAQIPGGMPRSTPVHGVVESFLKSKKYIVPSAVLSPIFAGCVAAVYVGTGAGRFEPGRDAMVYVVGGVPEPPLGREDRRAYQQQLKQMLAGAYPEKSAKDLDKQWEKMQSKAKAGVDHQGGPVLHMRVGDAPVQVGVSANNILMGNASPAVVRQLLAVRLQSVLHGKSSSISESEVTRDMKLLEQSMAARSAPKETIADSNPHFVTHSGPPTESGNGNQR
jgi:hypothetical protein